MSNQIYDILKKLSQVYLPSIAALYLTLSNIWHLPFGEEVSATIMAIDACLGAWLEGESKKYFAPVEMTETEVLDFMAEAEEEEEE